MWFTFLVNSKLGHYAISLLGGSAGLVCVVILGL
jgi:hypothetical protein